MLRSNPFQASCAGNLSRLAKNFEQGDLLYGLVDSRRPYVNELASERPNCQGPHIIDYMTPKIVRAANFLGYPTYEGHRGGSGRAGQLGDFLETHPKYNPHLSPEPNAEAYFTRKRRVCKGGLLFAISQGKRAHFILDKLDMKRVVEKSGKDNDAANYNGAKHRGYTGAELRSLYRMRDDQDAMSHVVFWENGKKVDAPWERDPELWATYTPRSGRGGPAPEPKKSLMSRLLSKLTG